MVITVNTTNLFKFFSKIVIKLWIMVHIWNHFEQNCTCDQKMSLIIFQITYYLISILVYLHSPSHQNSTQFCQTTLASPHFRDFILNMNVIVWGCSVETSEGYRVSQALRENSYPFLALIVLRQNRMMVVGRVEGLMNVEALCERLQVVIRDNEAYIVAANAERAERSMNAEIRQEQDAAFQETLRMDQERERLKREAEEAKIRAEEEEKEKERLEIARKEEIQRQKIELVSEIPQVYTYDF